MPADEGIRLDVYQRTAPGEQGTEGGHNPTRGIVGPSGFDLSFLEECQLFAEEEVLGGQGGAEWAARQARRIRSSTTKEVVRQQCATVRNSGKPNIERSE
jgi:hypothetical protein